MWCVEGYFEKAKSWNVAFSSGKEVEAVEQYHLLRSLFPDKIHRLIHIVKYSMWEEKADAERKG